MTSANGENEFDVGFGRIMHLQGVLEAHKNVRSFIRNSDIVFEIERYRQNDSLSIVCVDEYTASLEFVMRVVKAFPKTNVIFVGGKWNGFTREAYDFCLDRSIGIYNTDEIWGALHKDNFWTYEKLDDDGNSAKSIKA